MTLRMSDDWLRAHAKAESRVEFHGPRIALPVRKAVNELAWYQRVKLREQAQEKERAS